MSILRLAANMVATMDGTFNYGHLQIVNSNTDQDIEGKADVFLVIDRVDQHEEDTDYSPGSGFVAQMR
jgi:hypothetical protein